MGRCTRCRPQQKVVYAAFERQIGWRVVFFDSASKRRLTRGLLLEGDDKLYELAERDGRCVSWLTSRLWRRPFKVARVDCFAS